MNSVSGSPLCLRKALDAVRSGTGPTYLPTVIQQFVAPLFWRTLDGRHGALPASYWLAMLYSLVDTQCWSDEIRWCDATVFSYQRRSDDHPWTAISPLTFYPAYDAHGVRTHTPCQARS